MNAILNLFSWVASGLIESICPGGALVENISEELERYNESALKVGEHMQKAWLESLKTLEIALGADKWITPKKRKQFAEKFVKEIITPFAVENGLTGNKLDEYLKEALKQCKQLTKMSDSLLDFKSFGEKELLNSLVTIPDDYAAADMSILIIERIQLTLPEAKELLELLWYRNLLLEGLIAHFNFELSHNQVLAEILAQTDRSHIKKELNEIKAQLGKALNENRLGDMRHLGSRAAQLATADKLTKIHEEYKDLFGGLFERFDKLEHDHDDIENKLDEALKMLHKIEQMQQGKDDNYKIHPELALQKPSLNEIKLAGQLHTIVKDIGLKKFPKNKQTQTVNTLAINFYSTEKIDKTISILKESIDNDIATPEIYFNYFQALQAKGDVNQAVEFYNKAVELKPELALFPPEKYKMTGIIGKGGMGIVYKAQCIGKKIPVAVKVLLLPEEWYKGARERFLKAAKSAIKLKHKNIVLIHDFCNKDSCYPYIVMEYLDGVTLQQKVEKDGPYNLEEGLKIANEIGQGLLTAHKEGIIHRDLKPGNIVFRDKDPVIIDFGLSKSQNDSTLTLTGEFFYTLYYTPPEQLKNFHEVDIRGDIYSFGKTIYYLFTGDEPYDIYWDSLPKLIKPILQKATRKKPEDRYSNVAEMLEALDKINKGEALECNEADMNCDENMIVCIRTPKLIAPSKDLVKKLPSQYFKEDKDKVISMKDNSTMVYVPAGNFLMGEDSQDAGYDEKPMHEVFLNAYLIDINPVTNACYKKFLDDIDQLGNSSQWSHPDEPKSKTNYIPLFWRNTKWNQPNYPVVGVDWWDAYAYSKWAGKDLPTEAEWEKAARGCDGRMYPWGNEIPTPQICNFNKAYKKTTTVDKFLYNCSPYGCANMSGNVWEWCYDWYDSAYYKYTDTRNPRGPKTGLCRVGRGGSWVNNELQVRTITRGHGKNPEDRNYCLGFRTIKRLGSI